MRTSEDRPRLLLIAWAPSSPTFVDLATLLKGKVVYLNVLFGKRWAAPFRYLFLALRTFSLLIRERPEAVIAQNPPIFCPLTIVALRRFIDFRLVVDHHAVWSVKSIRIPFLSQAIARVERFVVKRADANITPNENWTTQFRGMGARNAFTYHDYLSRKPVSKKETGSSLESRLPPHQYLVIAAHGGHPEELLEEEIKAVEGLDDYLLVITGRREKIGRRLARVSFPKNVVYPGYLDQQDYEALKSHSDVALSLSKEPNTVPHALHEFISDGIPTIVLKDDLLRSIFDGSIVEAEDSQPNSIRKSLKLACENQSFRSKVLSNINSNYQTRFMKHQEEIAKLRHALESKDSVSRLIFKDG